MQSSRVVSFVQQRTFATFAPESQRTGVLAMKIGMMPVWDHWGLRQNCTVLQVEECKVVGHKTQEKHGYTALQIGGGLCKAKNVNKPQRVMFEKAGVEPLRSLQEFRITPDATVDIGTPLLAQHFVPGQYVDVCGTSIGKGFQGVMKRHNFAGQGASHGNSKAHRLLGSTGQCQDPGRVFKGKKMSGRMGNARVTRDNLKVIKIDPARNLLYVKGPVPGNKGGVIRVTDARKKTEQFKDTEPPFPTFVKTEDDDTTTTPIMAPHSAEDPLLNNL